MAWFTMLQVGRHIVARQAAAAARTRNIIIKALLQPRCLAAASEIPALIHNAIDSQCH